MIKVLLILVITIIFIEVSWNGLNSPKYSFFNAVSNIFIKKKHSLLDFPLNIDICKENLNLFGSILEKHNIFFWLSEGTALGIIREGNFIKHDDDVDLGIFFLDKDKFLNAFSDFKKLGFTLAEISLNKTFYCFIRKGEKIDIDITGDNIECMSIYRRKCNILLPYLKEFEKVKFNNKYYNVPKTDYLEFIYGKDWKIPKKTKNLNPDLE